MTPEQKAIEAVESCRDIADKHGDSEFYGQFVTRLNEALPVLRKMVEERERLHQIIENLHDRLEQYGGSEL
jgi:PII-like signaling protein